MKKNFLLLAIVLLAGLRIQADESSTPARSQFKPTLQGDEHDQPVFTSPTNKLQPMAHFTNAIPVPPLTNWIHTNLPPATNLPATNLPAMTNPPPVTPPF